jgi:ABC-2 type transport system ATP-binding protein
MTATTTPPDAPEETGVADAAVRTAGLTKRYGSLVAVDSLDLVVPRGAVLGIIGPNGAGKTTTFAIIASLLRPDEGRAWVCGHDVASDRYRVRAELGFMPDVLGVYDNLRVDEYLYFFASSYRIPRRERPALIGGLLELVDLQDKRTSMVDSLSRGMKQRLSLARALVHDPKVLILDEPASGLDPRARVELRELVAELHDMGKTIVVSSHILADLEEMCTDVAIMETGRLLASGPPRGILDQLGATRSVEVRFAGGAVETYTTANDREQHELLARLLAEGREVVDFHQTSGGLEELFLAVTEGRVQ